MFSPELEVCAESPQACRAAFEGGAQRIEICSALDQGGVTPSHGLIRAAVENANGLPVHVLLRPRAGDFVYSDIEFQTMCLDLEHAATLGVAGFVIGILTPERTVDEPRVAHLVKLAAAKQVTFHRAIDHCRDLFHSLEQIMQIGCGRVLTSGGRPTVREGMQAIITLSQQAANRVRIAAGGGLTPEIASELRRYANVDLHSSVREKNRSKDDSDEPDPLWTTQRTIGEISPADVAAMASTLAVRPGRP